MPFDIVIVSWNNLELLKKSFASLIESEAIMSAERIIVVDSGSTQRGIREFLKDLQNQYGVFLVLCPHNRGWGQTINEALGLSRAEYLFILNENTDYKERGFFSEVLKEFINTPNIGMIIKENGWMISKKVMQEIGMFSELNIFSARESEIKIYINKIKQAGFLIKNLPNNNEYI